MLLEAGDAYPLGEVLVWEPGRHYAQSFTLAQDPAYPSRLDVTFEVGKHLGGTRVRFAHGGWTPSNVDGRRAVQRVGPAARPVRGAGQHRRLRLRRRRRGGQLRLGGELRLVEVGVEAARGEQLGVAAALDDAAVVDDEDLVGAAHRRQPVGDDE